VKVTVMLPTSIRWRLPITYAVIALLTVIALGVVLVATLRAYYSEREWEYLNGNAHAIAEGIGTMLGHDAPLEIVQAQLENFSFLSQARIRLLDVDKQLIAESADPRDILISMVYTRAPAPPGGEEFGFIAWESNTGQVAITPGEAANPVPLDSVSPAATAQEIVPLMGVEENRDYFIRRFDGDETPPREFFYRFAVAGTPFGLGLNRQRLLDGLRSDQQVSISLSGPDDTRLGYIELSEGPAYGTEILKGVLQALVAAGIVAVVVAGGAGWYISRRITAPLVVLTRATAHMAQGQLSTRAEVEGSDEFGLLGRSFNQMATKVESTVLALRRFVADAAHELHTPLTALHANLELAATEDDETQRTAFIERAIEQLKRLELLTGGLLDLSRIEARSDSLERAQVDLVTLVRETSELYASRAEQAGLCFYFDLPDEPVIASINESQLKRALGNLLDNAIKFTPAEGVVGVGLTQHNGMVELWVKDSGIGIPAEDLPHIFSRFHRARNTAAYPGSGLGLAIIKAIVEGHCGQISVKSNFQGTCFALQLRLAPQKS
jgi:signal transduction histidine kinase